MHEETELEEMEWTDADKKSANKMAGLMFLISLGWVAFLLVTLAPSYPSKSAEGTFSDGVYCVGKKEYLKAYLCFTRSIKLNPNYSEAYWERASVGMKIDSSENSIDDLSSFISLSKNADSLRNAYFLRAVAEHKNGYISDACDDWRVSCELNLNKACDTLRFKCK